MMDINPRAWRSTRMVRGFTYSLCYDPDKTFDRLTGVKYRVVDRRFYDQPSMWNAKRVWDGSSYGSRCICGMPWKQDWFRCLEHNEVIPLGIKEYQLKHNNPYILPHSIYFQTLWIIRGYFYYKERMEDVILSTPEHDGMPKGGGISDPTAAKAMKIQSYARIVRVVEEERDRIQEEYREGVWRNIQYRERYPDYADVRTFNRHKGKFVYNVAVRLELY